MHRTALAAVALLALQACYDTAPAVALGDDDPGTGTGGALAVGPALYLDLDASASLTLGDEVQVTFDREVTYTPGPLGEFELPVEGDTLGAGVRLLEQRSPRVVRFRVGEGARLRTRGEHAVASIAAASGFPLSEALPITALTGEPLEPQTLDVFPQHTALPLGIAPLSSPSRTLCADFTGNGQLDLIEASREPSGRLRWTNQEQGAWVLRSELLLGSPVEALLEADLRQEGTPRFYAATLEAIHEIRTWGLALEIVQTWPLPAAASSLLAADLERDGQADLLVGTASGLMQLGLDGTLLSLHEEPVRALTIGDLDRDGDPDLVVAGGQQVLTLMNECGDLVQGTSFALASATDLALAPESPHLAVANSTGLWLLGTDQGFLTLAGHVSLPSTRLWWEDHDGDSHFGLTAAGAGPESSSLQWSIIDDPLGSPTVSTTQLEAEEASWARADLDADGDLDCILSGPLPTRLLSSFSGTHGAWLVDQDAAPLSAGACAAMASGDLDADGDADLVLAELGLIRVLWNEAGSFAQGPSIDTGANRVEDLVVVDLDQDGWTDILSAGTVNGLQVHRGSATGWSLLGSDLIPETPPTNALAVGDLDGDGALDLVLGALRGHQDVVLLANWSPGSGDSGAPCTWTGLRVHQELSAKMTHDVALADIDGDGDLDAGFAHGVGERSALWFNAGDGTFAGEQLRADDWATEALLLEDFNGDGRPDLLLCGEDRTVIRPNEAGTLPFWGFPVPRSHTTSAALADLDGDGHLDLVTTHDFGYPTVVCLGPWPLWTAPPTWTAPAGDHHQALFVDLDGDGAEELIETSELEGSPGRLWRAR